MCVCCLFPLLTPCIPYTHTISCVFLGGLWDTSIPTAKNVCGSANRLGWGWVSGSEWALLPVVVGRRRQSVACSAHAPASYSLLAAASSASVSFSLLSGSQKLSAISLQNSSFASISEM